MFMLNHGREWDNLGQVSVNELIPLYRLWFNTLIPRSHESRMAAHEWSCDTLGNIQVIPL